MLLTLLLALITHSISLATCAQSLYVPRTSTSNLTLAFFNRSTIRSTINTTLEDAAIQMTCVARISSLPTFESMS